jgi:hypothetical protein
MPKKPGKQHAICLISKIRSLMKQHGPTRGGFFQSELRTERLTTPFAELVFSAQQVASARSLDNRRILKPDNDHCALSCSRRNHSIASVFVTILPDATASPESSCNTFRSISLSKRV